MDFCLDSSLVDVGIDTVVVGIAKNVDPQAVLPVAFLEKKASNGRMGTPVSVGRSCRISGRYRLYRFVAKGRAQYQEKSANDSCPYPKHPASWFFASNQ